MCRLTIIEQYIDDRIRGDTSVTAYQRLIKIHEPNLTDRFRCDAGPQLSLDPTFNFGGRPPGKAVDSTRHKTVAVS